MLRESFARLAPYADDVTVTARPEILYWHAPRPAEILNTVRHVSAPDHRIPALVEEVRQAHRGGPSSWNVSCDAGGVLPRALAGAGYVHDCRARGLWLHPRDFRARPAIELSVELVDDDARLRDFFRVDAAVFGGGQPPDPREYETTRRSCLGQRSRLACFVAYDRRTAEPIACGRLYPFPERGFGLLQASGTVPHARHRGAYSALCEARIAYARSRGLRCVGLYAKETTSAPIAIRLGFRECDSITVWSCARVR